MAEALLLRRTTDDEGLKELVSDLGDIDARAVNTIEIGNGIELRVGRYGPYIERNGERVTISDEIAARRADRRARPRSCSSQATTSASSASNPETGRDGRRSRTAATART